MAMNPFIHFLIYTWYVQQMVVSPFFPEKRIEKAKVQDITLVGSTPGDSLIKTMLTIPQETIVDFIRWELNLTSDGNRPQAFSLNLEYGEAQPNTLGFKQGGQKQILEGSYIISRNKNSSEAKMVYEFKNSVNRSAFYLVRLTENLFHLLTPDQDLMVGNGGWSYTLNRRDPVPISSNLTASAIKTPGEANDTTLQVVYDGRTPCREIARDRRLAVTPDCFKLKWRLILNRDPGSRRPGTYQLRWINRKETDFRGSWTIRQGTPSYPHALIIVLDPEKPDRSISLLVGDKNVLYFLDPENRPYVGNGDFSFTLNRKFD